MRVNLKRVQKEFVQDLRNKNRSTSTIIAYDKDLDQLTKHLFKYGLTAVEEVELKHLETFIERLYEIHNLTQKSVSRKINSIKSFYKYLADKGYVKQNPADSLKHPQLTKGTPRIFSKVEYMALRETARRDARSYAIVELLLQTGLRISELANVEIEHMDLGESATLFVPKRESQKERVIPLNSRAKEIISQYLAERQGKIAESTFLFATKSGKAMLIRNIRASMERIFKRAGLENARVNDLRHTFTAHQLMQGVSVQTVSRVAGHKTITTTQKYLKYVKLDKGGTKETLEEL